MRRPLQAHSGEAAVMRGSAAAAGRLGCTAGRWAGAWGAETGACAVGAWVAGAASGVPDGD